MRKLMAILLAVVMIGLPFDLACGAGRRSAAGIAGRYTARLLKRRMASAKKKAPARVTRARMVSAKKIKARYSAAKWAAARRILAKRLRQAKVR